jgi:hypothetical protein
LFPIEFSPSMLWTPQSGVNGGMSVIAEDQIIEWRRTTRR